MATYSSNSYLSEYGSEMTANARYIFSFFKSKGWSNNSICAMLGNMQHESTLNPGIWQNLDSGNTSLGIGLVQWTPATKLIEWCNEQDLSYTSLDAQCKRIIYELENGLQWIPTTDYPERFTDFKESNRSISYLVNCFLKNYERAGIEAIESRIKHANHWFNVFSKSSYNPRLTSDGMEDNPYYYSKNPFYTSGYGLPNCTCYAWGRFWEISDTNKDYTNPPTLSTRNAENWYPFTDDGYERGSTPRLGAIICWRKGVAGDSDDGAGHVAVVEEVFDNGDITISQSAWDGGYFWTQKLTASENYAIPNQTFQGFIYNPFVSLNPGGDETTKKKKKKFKFILFGRNRRIPYGQR